MADVAINKRTVLVKNPASQQDFPGSTAPPVISPDVEVNFLELVDTPDTYTGQDGKFVRVKNTEDGVEFADAVGSKWTDGAGTSIYRSSSVTIGSANSFISSTLVVQQLTSTNSDAFIVKGFSGTDIFKVRTQAGAGNSIITIDGTLNITKALTISSNTPSDAGIFDAKNAINGGNFIGRNSANTITFRVLQDGSMNVVRSITQNGFRNTFTAQGIGGYGAGVIDITSTTTSGNDSGVLRCFNNSGSLVFGVFRNYVRLNTLPTSDPLIAGVLWNDSGTLKISAG